MQQSGSGPQFAPFAVGFRHLSNESNGGPDVSGALPEISLPKTEGASQAKALKKPKSTFPLATSPKFAGSESRDRLSMIIAINPKRKAFQLERRA